MEGIVKLKMEDGVPEMVRTPRGSFYLADATYGEMKARGFGEHHRTDDGLYAIMTANNKAYAVIV